METIVLPGFFKELLNKYEFNFAILEAINDFYAWFNISKTPFFPDYTDHGNKHLEEVFESIDLLITEKARKYFTSADAGVMVLAVLFHDCAMHLSKDGFRQLITEKYSNNIIKYFDNKTWKQLWDDFLFTARRWDEQQLINIFGTDNYLKFTVNGIQDPLGHWDDLGDSDYRLVGEFIRRNHARFAHEISIYGVPGYAGSAFKINERLPKEHLDLAGLIARSHNLSIRDCLGYLSKIDKTKRNYQGIHAVYLMALLRVADIMQIHASRASGMALKCRKIVSPFSRNEFLSHQSVSNISTNSDDNEALWIQAKPQTVTTFLRLKDWLLWIQNEFDTSWAVLGEIYGSQEELRHLGLRYRRILSNLDDVAAFTKEENINYVPARIHFDIARAEMLKLLIRPLYGDDPTYGIRELMQNSIDSVREYDVFSKRNPEYRLIHKKNHTSPIHVDLSPIDESGQATLVISDLGIGMSEEIIVNYFLKAGASYRQNAEWKLNFESDAVQRKSAIKSIVLRSGRFGVGALAAFLLGDEIEVESKHIKSEVGYRFRTALDTDLIELIRDSNIDFGTVIRIRISAITYNKLLDNKYKPNRPTFWNWYCMSYPKVTRTHPLSFEETTSSNSYDIDINNNSIWRLVISNLPYQIYWSTSDGPAFSCNGIFISDSPVLRVDSKKLYKHPNQDHPLINYPAIAIIDPDGNLPLNLARNGINGDTYPFNNIIFEDILTEMIAWIFSNGPKSINDTAMGKISLRTWINHRDESVLVACKKGYGLVLHTLLNHMFVEHLICYLNTGFEVNITNTNTLVFGGDYYVSDSKADTFHSSIHGVDDKNDRMVREVLKASRSVLEHKGLVSEEKIGDWTIAKTKDCPSSMFEIKAFPKHNEFTELLKNESQPILRELFLPSQSYIQANSKPWLLDKIWQKFFGSQWLPFDIDERIKLFPDAAVLFRANYPQVSPSS